MSQETPNPYESPAAPVTSDGDDLTFSARDRKLVEALVKDAERVGQVFLVFIVCMCLRLSIVTALAAMIIGPWYLVRIVQWYLLASRVPALADRRPPYGSLAHQFRWSLWRLLAGLGLGLLLGGAMTLIILKVISEVPPRGNAP